MNEYDKFMTLGSAHRWRCSLGSILVLRSELTSASSREGQSTPLSDLFGAAIESRSNPVVLEALFVFGVVILLLFWLRRRETHARMRSAQEIEDLKSAQVATELDASEQIALLERKLAQQQEQQQVLLQQAQMSLVTRRALDEPSASTWAQAKPPILGKDLLDALEKRELVVVLGHGASVLAGLPASPMLWRRMLTRYRRWMPAETIDHAAALFDQGADETAVELMVSIQGREQLLKILGEELLAIDTRGGLHRQLASLKLSAIVDLNWDDQMQRALQSAGIASTTFVPAGGQGLALALRTGEPVLIKPFGDLSDPESVSLTQREYRLALSRSPEFERSLAALFGTRTLLFIGFSIVGLEAFLAALPPHLEASSRQHYSLMVDDPIVANLWERGMGKRFGVRLLPYRPSRDHREVEQAVAELVGHANTFAIARERRSSPRSVNIRLKYLELESIGQFGRLRVDFSPNWTLLLGHNGGGKSTILRAIVLALAGDDGRATDAAARMLRAGDNTGKIDLGLGGSRIVTDLARDGDGVVLRSPQTTPVQAGQVLVLAFPALRGVTATTLRGPMNTGGADPSVNDIAPLLQGGVDGRLDNLQQWIVNTAIRADSKSGGRDRRMLKTFQSLVQEMVPGEELGYSHVDLNAWRVVFKTGGDDVTMEALSQGMSSILNWTGTLLQRLYDVYPQSEAPEKETAIVLIDEIDAHLHPEWQRRLVSMTRKHFPHVQIIASSHSPLLAGAVDRNELRVVARGKDGEASVSEPRANLAGQKAEDILLSELFSLSTTRDVRAETTIREYFRLFQKLDPDEDDKTRLQKLSVEMDSLNFGVSGRERSELEAIDARAEETLAKTTPEALSILKRRLRDLGGEDVEQGSAQ